MTNISLRHIMFPLIENTKKQMEIYAMPGDYQQIYNLFYQGRKTHLVFAWKPLNEW